jgi:cellobiose phosphorylase
MRDSELVGRLLTAINPALKDPDRYWAEPYVLPGNVDGPDSPLHGRAGWTWYTGSAAWLYQIVTGWVLGVRPTWDGLMVSPCLPREWSSARLRRSFRGTTYDILIERSDRLPAGSWVSLTLDGQPVTGDVLPFTNEARGLRHVRALVR